MLSKSGLVFQQRNKGKHDIPVGGLLLFVGIPGGWLCINFPGILIGAEETQVQMDGIQIYT